MKNRWISSKSSGTSANARQERRGSMGSVDENLSKASHCLSPSPSKHFVNGIPDWENPMEATLTSVHHSNESSPPTRPPIDTKLRRSPVKQPTSPVKHPASPRKQQVRNSPPNFTRMLIECDDDNRSNSPSDGELTFDESLVQDENFGKVRPNYQIPPEIRKATSAPSASFISPMSHQHSMNSLHSHPSISSCSSSIPVSPPTNHIIMDEEEEEMRQLQLAMERSLQDTNSHHSGMSHYSDRSNTNTVGSRYSAGGRRINDTGSTKIMTGAGCHLSMVSSSTSSVRHLPRAPTKSSSNQKRLESLQAIVEENEASSRLLQLNSTHHPHAPPEGPYSHRDDSYNNSDVRSLDRIPIIDPNLAAARLRELEREKLILEMALSQSQHQSVNDNPHEIHFQPPPGHTRHGPSTNRSIHSMNTNELLVRRTPRKSMSSRSTESQKSAGCHLQMYAERSQSTRFLNGSSNNSSTSLSDQNNNNIQSTASLSSTTVATKLVWKRGPNGAWGRFVDDGIDYSVNNNGNNAVLNHHSHHNHVEDDDEDAQIAEALRRSMQQM